MLGLIRVNFSAEELKRRKLPSPRKQGLSIPELQSGNAQPESRVAHVPNVPFHFLLSETTPMRNGRISSFIHRLVVPPLTQFHQMSSRNQ